MAHPVGPTLLSLRFPLALVALLALGAGCVAPAGPSGPSPARGASATSPLSVVPLPASSYAGEPRIEAAPDGTLFVDALSLGTDTPNAAQGAAWLWRSRDGGATWDALRGPADVLPRPGPLGNPLVRLFAGFSSLDSDVATSPDGWVYYLDWWSASVVAGNYVIERSHDDGATWQQTILPVPGEPATQTRDRPWLLAGDGGFVALAWSYYPRSSQGSPNAVEEIASRDHGASWSPVATAVPASSDRDLLLGRPARLGDGSFVMPLGVVPYSPTALTEPSSVAVGLSRDGVSWTVRTLAPVPGGFDNVWPVQAAAAGRAIVVAWSAHPAGSNATYTLDVVGSADGGGSWSTPQAVSSGGLAVQPWPAIDDAGRVAVAWYQANATGDPTAVPRDTAWVAERWEGTFQGSGFAPSGGATALAVVAQGPICPRGDACANHDPLADFLGAGFGRDGAPLVVFTRVDPQRYGVVSLARPAPS
jgi:hypothetical protein